MCIRDRFWYAVVWDSDAFMYKGITFLSYSSVSSIAVLYFCLLYTSDAADERSSVDLGGRRIIKKKNTLIEEYDAVF